MAFFTRHLWGGFLATLIAIALVGAGLWQTGQLGPYLTVAESPKLVLLIVIGLLSACFPDVDTGSRSQRLFYRLILLVDLWLLYQRNYKAAALLGLGAMLPLLDRHRGWTHTWLAALLVPAVFFLVPMLLNHETRTFLIICYIISVAAYMSHLVLDGYVGRTLRRLRHPLGR
jgi:hypothetical protein